MFVGRVGLIFYSSPTIVTFSTAADKSMKIICLQNMTIAPLVFWHFVTYVTAAVKHKKKTYMSWPIKERSSFTSVLFIHFELIQELVKAKLVIP